MNDKDKKGAVVGAAGVAIGAAIGAAAAVALSSEKNRKIAQKKLSVFAKNATKSFNSIKEMSVKKLNEVTSDTDEKVKEVAKKATPKKIIKKVTSEKK